MHYEQVTYTKCHTPCTIHDMQFIVEYLHHPTPTILFTPCVSLCPSSTIRYAKHKSTPFTIKLTSHTTTSHHKQKRKKRPNTSYRTLINTPYTYNIIIHQTNLPRTIRKQKIIRFFSSFIHYHSNSIHLDSSPAFSVSFQVPNILFQRTLYHTPPP